MRRLAGVPISLAIVYAAISSASAAPLLFFCESESTSPITVNLNFGEWFDEDGNRGEIVPDQGKDTFQLSYKGRLATLHYKGKRSNLSFSNNEKFKLSCDSGGTGQTPGE